MAECGGVPLQIRARENLSRVRIQSLALEAVATPRLRVLDGRPLPQSVGEVASGTARVLCIGPGEWLVVSAEPDAMALCAQLETDTDGRCVNVDLSDGLTTIELTGGAVRRLLSKGCGLDLHAQTLGKDHCARTRLADLAVIIDCIDEGGRFELHVSRSYGAYLSDWLRDAAA